MMCEESTPTCHTPHGGLNYGDDLYGHDSFGPPPPYGHEEDEAPGGAAPPYEPSNGDLKAYQSRPNDGFHGEYMYYVCVSGSPGSYS